MEIKDILSKVDHTNLKVDAREEDIKTLCDDAIKYKTASVCIPPSYVKFASNYIKSKESKETIHIEKGEPIYNIISVSINNILFLIKENSSSNDSNDNSKPKYFNLFSKNKSVKYDSTDYFFMTFKFRNLKKTNNDMTIVELDEDEDSDENMDKSFEKKISKESDLKSRNSDKFKEKNL